MPEQTNVSGTLADEAYSASKKFLSSVLFVDDEIKMGEKTGEGLSATNITDAFAAASIVPSFYSCSHENQYEKILALIRKTDVFVLDWKMPVKRANAEENPDADADPDRDRGFFAKKLIEALRKDESLGPRLIFIYTSEFDEVVKYIKSLLGSKHRPGEAVETAALGGDSEVELSKDATDEKRPATGRNEDLEWISTNGNVRICAYFKESLKDNHGVDQSRVLTEAQLAEFVLKEYAKLHEGILPITLLHLLSTVRENERALMEKFNAELDLAFVIDRAMTPEPQDADHMLVGMMINLILSLVNDKGLPRGDTTGLVKRWVSTYCKRTKDPRKVKLDKEVIVDVTDPCRWQEVGYEKFFFDSITKEQQDELIEKDAWERYEKYKLKNDVINVFVPDGVTPDDVMIRCRDYAVLSQWKCLASSQKLSPFLTLGTVLTRRDNGKYYLCVQPSCDTVRIPSDGRDFLFLPLDTVGKKFDLVLKGVDSAVLGLKVAKNVYDLTKVHFTPLEGSTETVVRATQGEDKRFFFTSDERDKDENPIEYTWAGDLIETHALKIVHDYISKFGRVGIEESEWLRRS